MAPHTNQSGSASQGGRASWPEDASEPHITHPAFCTDQFRMYEFKVKACPRTRAHDWTQCPFAHPGEKARRRDPRKHAYSAVPCPDYRKGTCKRGDSCEYAHGVFECWLHPTRYRTQMCTDGPSCQRPVCFFAHHQGQLRLPSETCQVAPPESPRSPRGRVERPAATAAAAPPQMDKLASDQLFSLALAHLLALQNQQQQQQQQHQHQSHPYQQGHQYQLQQGLHQGVHQGTPAAAAALQQAVLQQSVPYYPQMQAAKQAAAYSHPGDHHITRRHPLSPSSPLQADFAGGMGDQSGFGSMDNLLSSLPRTLSDVGLADAAQS